MLTYAGSAALALANALRMRIFAVDFPLLKLQVLDTVPSTEKNKMPIEGTTVVKKKKEYSSSKFARPYLVC